VPLTREEREFLDAYVYEATHGPPFGGPATADLKERGIYYRDLSWILTAYQRELSARGEIPNGLKNPRPPRSPWHTLEDAKLRNEVLQEELEPRVSTMSGARTPTKPMPT
jgi:hypothetical protein